MFMSSRRRPGVSAMGHGDISFRFPRFLSHHLTPAPPAGPWPPEVRRIKPLGEPAVDRRQQVVGFGTLALLLPQATEADGSPQLQRLRLLAAGKGEGLLEAGFCLVRVGTACRSSNSP